MIRYHGTPITPEAAAIQILKGRHGMVSFANPEQIGTVAEVCQSFVLDNGAFTFWRGGKKPDWDAFTFWASEWVLHPGFDWLVIPDVIDGTEAENRKLVSWFLDRFKVWQMAPVWHLHESIDWLRELAGMFPRVCFGSSGDYSQPGTEKWEGRMDEAFAAICDRDGRPQVKVHGLRMMNPTLFSRYPFASVDSCNVARNIGLDASWDSFKYGRAIRKSVRGVVMAQHCEDHASATVWVPAREKQYELLFG